MTSNATSPLVNPPRTEPVVSALTGYPMYPLSGNCTKEDWLNDPRFSTEHFKKFGGLEAVAELMRENADETDMTGIPISLICYRDFICDRASLVGKEKDEVYSRWAADHPEGVLTFDKVESYMLSAASFTEKLDAMHKANLLMEEVMAPRLEKEREEQDERIKKYMDEQARAPFKKEIDRTKGAQAGADRAYNDLRLEKRRAEKNRDDFKNALVKAIRHITDVEDERRRWQRLTNQRTMPTRSPPEAIPPTGHTKYQDRSRHTAMLPRRLILGAVKGRTRRHLVHKPSSTPFRLKIP